MAVTAERAAAWAGALRAHLRAMEVHARYVEGYDLDVMTPRELVELHDDLPAHVRSCWDFPSDYHF